MFHLVAVLLVPFCLQPYANSSLYGSMLSSSMKGSVAARLNAKASYDREDFITALLVEDLPLLDKIIESNNVEIDNYLAQTGLFVENIAFLDLILTRAGPEIQEKLENAIIRLADLAVTKLRINKLSLDHLKCVLKHGYMPSVFTIEALIQDKKFDILLRTIFDYYKGPATAILMDAFFLREQDDVWILKELVQLGCAVEGFHKYSNKPYLYRAIELGLYESARLLLKARANPNGRFERFHFSESILDLSLTLGRLDFFSLLVEHGADTVASDSWTPMHQRWLRVLQRKNIFMTMSAGVIDGSSALSSIPSEILAEIFSHLV